MILVARYDGSPRLFLDYLSLPQLNRAVTPFSERRCAPEYHFEVATYQSLEVE